jgi:hypothetical protein
MSDFKLGYILGLATVPFGFIIATGWWSLGRFLVRILFSVFVVAVLGACIIDHDRPPGKVVVHRVDCRDPNLKPEKEPRPPGLDTSFTCEYGE